MQEDTIKRRRDFIKLAAGGSIAALGGASGLANAQSFSFKPN